MENKKRIRLVPGAPELKDLSLELRMILPVPFSKENYEGGDLSPNIGRPVETVLDGANEERLILLNGQADINDYMSLDFVREIGDMPEGVKGLEWVFCLVDKHGQSWSELTDEE